MNDEEISAILDLSESDLLGLINFHYSDLAMKGDFRSLSEFVAKNIIDLRDILCGQIDDLEKKQAAANRVGYVKDIATLLTAIFPPAILIYAAAAVVNYGIKNVCK